MAPILGILFPILLFSSPFLSPPRLLWWEKEKNQVYEDQKVRVTWGRGYKRSLSCPNCR